MSGRWLALDTATELASVAVGVPPAVESVAVIAGARGDLDAASTHLDAAGELFAQHGGARLYLDQVLAKKQLLGA